MDSVRRMEPDLELVQVGQDESFKVWAHGYPFRTVRWHFHPEYEIHLVTHTTGRSFVGDHIGTFAPGNLVMVGPNLPHNWLSDLPPGAEVPQRCIVVQFTEAFVAGCLETFPELRPLSRLLADSRRGVEFGAATGAAALPRMRALLGARGIHRASLFLELLGTMQECGERRPLSSPEHEPDPAGYMREPLNHVLAHIARNFRGDLHESELAMLSGHSPSSFSRAFRRHTGVTFVQYVNRLRINRACEMLMGEGSRVTDICFRVGFNNLSNFNRQFLALKHMPPSAFRLNHLANAAPGHRAGMPAGSASTPPRRRADTTTGGKNPARARDCNRRSSL